MPRKIILAWLVCFLLWGQPVGAAEAGVRFKENDAVVRSISVAELAATVPVVEKTVYDPLEQTTVTYKAMAFNAVIEKIYGGQHSKVEELLFTCSDGFQPRLNQAQFDSGQAYLAFERVGQKAFTLFDKIESKKTVNLAPLYLIWDLPKDAPKHEWAYSIVGLDRVRFAQVSLQITPPAASTAAALRGFVAFRNNCLACHTINGDGGAKAPELNFPVSVTEYYNEAWLNKWIADPSAIRWNTPMPAVMGAASAERDAAIADIIAYLKVMAANKRVPLTK